MREHALYPQWVGKERAAVDVFRFDQDGRIVERWDVLQAVPDTAAKSPQCSTHVPPEEAI